MGNVRYKLGFIIDERVSRILNKKVVRISIILTIAVILCFFFQPLPNDNKLPSQLPSIPENFPLSPKAEFEFRIDGLEPHLLKHQTGKENDVAVFEQIIAESKKYDDLTPGLVISVIEAESNFDERAVSSAGAVGIMQIMPKTGKWLASMMGKKYEQEYLYDPLYNIELGCFYLSWLLERYDGNLHSALTAYNRGMTGLEDYERKNKTTVSSYSEKIIEGVEQY